MSIRRIPYGIVALSFIVLGCSAGDDGIDRDGETATGSENNVNPSGATACTPGEVFTCACTNGLTSQQICNDSGMLDPCMCATATGAGGSTVSTGGVSSTGGTPATGVGGTAGTAGTGGAMTGTGGTGGSTTGTGGSTTGTGGTGGSTTGTGGSTTGTGGSTTGTGGSTTGTGGTGGSTTGTGGTGGSTTGTAGSTTGTDQDPAIPAVDGPCPTFTNQTFDFNGLTGIQMQAGPMGSGDGALLFYWHGTGSSAGEVRLIPTADQQRILDAGGIIVSAQGTSGQGTDCSGTGTWHTGDIEIADQIAACAVRDYNINPHRIYATGCSAGGLFSGCMALRRPEYIAAVAPNSGGGFGNFTSTTHIPAVMTMHGAPGQDVVVIDFSESSASFTSLVTSAGGFAVNCNHGGGHCAAPGDLYSAAIDFLLDHPFGVSPKPYASGLPAGFPSYCEIVQ